MFIRRDTYEALLVTNAEMGTQVRHLEGENKELRERLETQRRVSEYERERGEIATDELLRQLGSAPVTPPPKYTPETDPFIEDPDEVKAIMSRIEEVGAGPALLEAVE